MPLWAVDAPVVKTVEPNLAIDGTGGGVYYIYHVASGRFMSNGNYLNNWNTELVVADKGQAVTLHYGDDYALGYDELDNPNPEYPYKGWRLLMKNAPTNGGFHDIFFCTDSYCCVDHNIQGHILWTIEKNAAGDAYVIRVIDDDNKYGFNTTGVKIYMGVDPSKEPTGVNPSVNPDGEGGEAYGIDWKFVAAQDYEVFVAKKVLYKQLVAAETAGYTVPDTYTALYNNDAADPAEVEAAATKLAGEILNHQYATATPENPTDVTGMVVNADFGQGNLNGWTTAKEGNGNNVQYQKSTYDSGDGAKLSGFVERWVKAPTTLGNWSVLQEIKGLPDGKYRLTADIWADLQGDTEVKAEGFYLVAKSIGAEARATADIAPELTGHPKNAQLEFSVLGNKATIGFRVENANFNWAGADNFKLYYLGNDGATGGSLLQSLVDMAEQKKNSYDEDNKLYGKAVANEYNEVVAAAKQLIATGNVEEADIVAASDTLQALMDRIDNEVKAYATLQTQLESKDGCFMKYMENESYAGNGLPLLEGYMSELQDAYENGTFDVVEVDSIAGRAEKFFMQDVSNLLTSGDTDDVTGLIVNPDFANGATGWSGSPVIGSGVAERYMSSNYDVYQTITGLPQGSYEISMQGFYRPATNAICQAAWGTESTDNDVLAYLYGNDAQVKMPHVYSEVFDEALSDGSPADPVLVLPDDPERDGKYVPNNLKSTDVAINQLGAYKVSLKCYVGEDGVLRFGSKMGTSTLDGYWATFDNFSIKYLGAENMEGFVSILNGKITEAKDEQAAAGVTTTEAKNALNLAINNATRALEETLSYEVAMKCTNDINEAIALSKAGREAISKLDTYASDLDTRISEDAEFATAGYDDEVLGYTVGDALDAIDDGIATAAEANDWYDKIVVEYNKMMLQKIDVAGADKDNGVEMTAIIQNPSFEKMGEDGLMVSTGEGWTYEKDGGNNAANYQVYEFFNNNSFNMHQTLNGITPGWYKMTFQGFYRAGGYIEAAVAHRDGNEALNSVVYAKTSNAEYTEPLASIIDNVRERKYVSGDVVLPDSLFPGTTRAYNCIVNNMEGVKKAFNRGAYQRGLWFHVEEDGVLTIGIKKDEHISNDWAIFDNFQLFYYGNGEQPTAVEATEKAAAVVVRTNWYTINGVAVVEPSKPGVYVREDLFADGTKASKVVIKK